MKRTLAILLSAVLLLSLAGCNTSPSPAPAEPTASGTKTGNDTAPKTGKTVNGEVIDDVQFLSVLANGEPSSLDSARFNILADRQVFYNVLEPLVVIKNGIVTGAGAETWEISDDGLTYTFHLRKNYWSDGQQVTAEDYALNFRRQADPANVFTFIDNLKSIHNMMNVNLGEAEMSELGVVVLDDMTLEITLDDPNPEFLTTEEFYPCRADYVEKYGDRLGTEAETVASCGPFVLKEWIHDSKLSFVRNELYWNKDNIYLDGFDYLIITDSTAQYAALENGTLSYLLVTNEDQIKKLSSRTDMFSEVYRGARTSMFVFNTTSPAFSNQKIRQAFSLSVDRDLICEVLNAGLPTPAYGLIPVQSSVGSNNYRENVEEPLLALMEEYSDPKALLLEGMKEAGLGDDPSKLTVTLSHGNTSATGRTVAEFYQQMWSEALGVNIELRFLDGTTNLANMTSGDFEFSSMSWGANIEPQFQLSRWYEGNDARWFNEEYDALVSKGSSTVDETERLRLYAEAEKILLTEAPIATISYSGSMRFAYNYIRGLQYNSFDTTGLQTLYTVGK